MNVLGHKLLRRLPYGFPVVSAFLLVLATPPFGLWWLIFVALIPLYLFIFKEIVDVVDERRAINKLRLFTGSFVFAAIFSGYISYVTVLGFDWIDEAYLFSGIVHLLPIPIILASGTITALILLAGAYLGRNIRTPLKRALLFSSFALPEFLITHLLAGLNYGALAYPGLHFPPLLHAASIGGAILITALVAFSNAALAEVLMWMRNRGKGISSLLPAAVVGVIFLLLAFSPAVPQQTAPGEESVSVALIQDQKRSEDEIFGRIVDGEFYFPRLEKQLVEAGDQRPDLIIYPFAPWLGVIAESVDNTRFDREVVVIDYDTFASWQSEHVPQETVLAIWVTSLHNGTFRNEIQFWKNGMLAGAYQKQDLFPFFDYTPDWAQRIGLYSTPYDITAGTTNSTVLIDGVPFGALVCSEVISPSVALQNSQAASVLLAIGSEAMFPGSFTSEFNLLNTQLRAAETATPIIRSNKFGPSAFVRADGSIAAELPYGKDGVLTAAIEVHEGGYTSPYERFGPYPILIFLGGYLVYLWYRNNKPARAQ